ncbi:hypothetical protein SDRG_00686 [Saprolegnia diclina VS20]|uniref:Uncharacterized protein n=1 Tax=Saprolegnia diclina (strain VS20) TaxID=1156394 RepID=T0SFP0_SAPDV|nr:hypothetical protein SDRG_00686 [Saprolegnia diclina VS20]EQC41827.1 hypothetical protein SDRG_00686 [Saprolegnia diclina VS20]|eukprot:XP_008604396.1 hypothetical protein SDRG_00686 [Saprolegnia diclina VS20]
MMKKPSSAKSQARPKHVERQGHLSATRRDATPKRTPLQLAPSARAGNATYLLAKGPDGTRGFYSRSQKLSIHAHEFVPNSR